MAYNHRKISKLMAQALESNAFITINYPLFKGKNYVPVTQQEALSFIERTREAMRLEDCPIIVEHQEFDDKSKYCTYLTNNDRVRISASFILPSTEDKL